MKQSKTILNCKSIATDLNPLALCEAKNADLKKEEIYLRIDELEKKV